jgi:hypothetical protein
MAVKHYYVASDGMGNVTAILDEDGNILSVLYGGSLGATVTPNKLEENEPR